MKRIILTRSADIGGVGRQLPKHRCKLTTKGKRQTESIKQQLAQRLGFGWKPDTIFQSDSCPDTQTSTGIYGEVHPAELPRRRVLPSLFADPEPNRQNVLSAMFDDMGCASLNDYFDKYGRAGEQGYRIMDLAQKACTQIRESHNSTADIAVIGHPVLLAAVIYFLTSDIRWWYETLSECETVVLDMVARENFRICPSSTQ